MEQKNQSLQNAIAHIGTMYIASARIMQNQVFGLGSANLHNPEKYSWIQNIDF